MTDFTYLWVDKPALCSTVVFLLILIALGAFVCENRVQGFVVFFMCGMSALSKYFHAFLNKIIKFFRGNDTTKTQETAGITSDIPKEIQTTTNQETVSCGSSELYHDTFQTYIAEQSRYIVPTAQRSLIGTVKPKSSLTKKQRRLLAYRRAERSMASDKKHVQEVLARKKSN